MRQIAKEAGLSSATILHHFGSKRELFAVVLKHISESLENNPVLSNPGAAGPDTLQAVVEALVNWVRTHDDFARISMREALDTAERVENAKRWPLKAGMETIHKAFETAMDCQPGNLSGRMLALQVLGASFLFYVGEPVHRLQAGVPDAQWKDEFCRNLVDTALRFAKMDMQK